MNTQMIICMVIFAATLVSYMLNKIPMWLTAMISLAALYFTGCIDANGALAGFSNVNTLLMPIRQAMLSRLWDRLEMAFRKLEKSQW